MPQLILGFEAIRSYKRLSYDPWSALAEFVDSSTQSYFNNRKALDQAFAREQSGLRVAIRYDREGDFIRIEDNAMGMKTAACWLGDLWTVRTKLLGSKTELTVTIDVESVASGDNELPMEKRDD